jgi:predicted dehydrogenase
MSVSIVNQTQNACVGQVVVVGAGNWGRNLVRNFYELKALAGVVELDAQLREEVNQKYPTVKVYGDYQEALSLDVAAMVIATPAPTHYHLARAALEAGKHVFVEKPMTLKQEQARELTEYADQVGRCLMVGHLLLYQPAIRWMVDYLAKGEAGEVWHVSTERLKLGRVRREENVWWSFAPHDISVVLALLGQPSLRRVQASGQAMLQEGIEDDVRVQLQFDEGKTAHLHCSWYWPELRRQTVVLAQKQMVVYDEVAQKVTVYDKGVDGQLNNRDEGSFVVKFTGSEPLRLECEHFLESIAQGTRPNSDGWNGLAVVSVLEQAMEVLNG